MQDIHLLVAVHGMWGNPKHLAEVARLARERFADAEGHEDGTRYEILVAQTNSESATYDGIDWGGERVADEVQAKIKELEQDGSAKVTKFSVVGYSLGGLLSRYLIGILYSRNFFDNVRPMNFTTIATPNIGLLLYPNLLSSMMYKFGPKLLSRTGEQFYANDQYTASGKPLLLAMSDKNKPFWKALAAFKNLSIYGSVTNDGTVPYSTALIEEKDPFIKYEENGVVFTLDEKYTPIVVSYQTSPEARALAAPPKFGTRAYWKSLRSKRPFLPPRLQLKFPFNIPLYLLLPFLVPVVLGAVVSRLAYDQSHSRKRIKLLEEDETAAERLMHMLRRLEKDMEDVVVEMIESPAGAAEGFSNAESSLQSNSVSIQTSSSATTSSSSLTPLEELTTGEQPVLLDVQKEIAANLNSLPNLKKYAAFFPDTRMAHAMIVCRDVDTFPDHRRGEGVLRHWIDHFQL